MDHWTDRFVGKPQLLDEKSDEEIAGLVRMLTRSDLEHEVIVTAARDRIARLSREVHEYRQECKHAS